MIHEDGGNDGPDDQVPASAISLTAQVSTGVGADRTVLERRGGSRCPCGEVNGLFADLVQRKLAVLATSCRVFARMSVGRRLRLLELHALLVVVTLAAGCVGISIEELTELAEQGDTESAYDLAHAYYVGRGVDRDFSTAKTWFSRAARQGHPCAATYVGRILDHGGFGVEQDGARALEWYALGTERRDTNAYLIFGLRHLNPAEGRPNYQVAAQWLEDGLGPFDGASCVASREHRARASFNLAMMYFDGTRRMSGTRWRSCRATPSIFSTVCAFWES